MDFRNYVDDVSSSVKPKNNGFLIVFIATVITVLVDSQIGLIADFIPEYLTSSFGISLFVGLTIFSIFSSFFMINYVRHINSLTAGKYAHFKLIYYLVFGSKYLITSFIFFLVCVNSLKKLVLHVWCTLYAFSYLVFPSWK